MKDEQFTELCKIMAATKEPVAVKHDLVDSLSKIGVALCTAAILWVASQMSGLTTDMAVMKTQVETFTKFTEEPRFTAQMNDAADQKMLGQIKDIVSDLANEIHVNENDIDKIVSEFARRSEFMDDTIQHKSSTSKRLTAIEVQLENLKKEQ